MMKRKYLIFGIVLFTASIAGYLVWRNAGTNIEAANYQTEKVVVGNVAQAVSANGTLNPVILVNVGTQVTGIVKKYYADFNDRVKAGQVLLELDPTLLQAAVTQSTAAVEKAQSNLDLAINNEKRGQKLVKDKYISEQDWEQLIQLRKSAQADLDLARAKLSSDKTNLSFATILSPVSGVVVNRQVDVGQTVTASFQTPILFAIAQDLGKMQIDSSFAEADIGNIKPGQEATFTVDAFPDRNFIGIVKQIRLNPTIQQNVVTYDVVVIVDNSDGVLLPGMTAYVNIKTAEHKNVLLVPNAALRFKPSKNGSFANRKIGNKLSADSKIIYKSVDGKIKPVRCRLGLADSRNTEITCDQNQIKEGDLVIVGENQEESTTTTTGSSFRLRVF